MQRANDQTLLRLLALVCLLAVGCSDTNNATPAPDARRQFQEVRAPVVLEDGVYPVVPPDDPLPGRGSESEGIVLINVPVEGSGDSIPDRIRVIPRPLLRFQSVSHFDFTFEKNECTEIAFRNTDELKAYTRDHVGSRLAVVIDNRVISHHKIREAIEADRVRITCCTAGGGDHLHKHLTELKLTSASAAEKDRSGSGGVKR